MKLDSRYLPSTALSDPGPIGVRWGRDSQETIGSMSRRQALTIGSARNGWFHPEKKVTELGVLPVASASWSTSDMTNGAWRVKTL